MCQTENNPTKEKKPVLDSLIKHSLVFILHVNEHADGQRYNIIRRVDEGLIKIQRSITNFHY